MRTTLPPLPPINILPHIARHVGRHVGNQGQADAGSPPLVKGTKVMAFQIGNVAIRSGVITRHL